MISLLPEWFSSSPVLEKVLVTLISTGAVALVVFAIKRAWSWLTARDLVRRECQRFRDECRALRDRVRSESGGLWEDEAEIERLCRDFESRVRTFLQAHHPGHVSTFDADTTTRPERYQPAAPEHVSNWGNWIERRLDALDRIIEKG